MLIFYTSTDVSDDIVTKVMPEITSYKDGMELRIAIKGFFESLFGRNYPDKLYEFDPNNISK